MKIEVNEHGTIVLKEVFNPIKLQTIDNETLIVMMKDSGYEICYENKWYELKQGNIKPLKNQNTINLQIEIQNQPSTDGLDNIRKTNTLKYKIQRYLYSQGIEYDDIEITNITNK